MGRTVLVCEPAEPGTGPVELGRLKAGVGAVTVLPDGRVVTGGYDYQVRLRNVRAAHPALCAHAPRTRSLVPSPHLELASSSVTQWAEFHAGRYAQQHRTRLEPGNVRVTRCINRRECPHGLG